MVLLAVTLSALSPMESRAQGASEIFLAATEAFEAEDYATALVLFERSRDAGSAGPAVHYNIGVCQYELGRYDQAEATFRELGDNFPAMRALAEYNVGMTLFLQDRRESAEEHFVYARDNSDDETLVSLARTALTRLNPETAQIPARNTSWAGLFDITFGYDDNVALVDESTIPVGQTAESPYAEFVAVLTGPLSGGPGMRFDGSFYAVSYDDAGEFDQSVIRLGGFYHGGRRSGWRWEIGPYLNQSTLDGNGFERRLGASLSARHGIGATGMIGFRLTHAEVDEIDSQYAFISGSRQQLTFSWDKYGESGRVTLEYQLEDNDRRDPGVSPSRNRIRMRYRHAFTTDLSLDAAVSFRESSYDQLVVSRKEDLAEASLEFIKNLSGGWQFRGRYAWSDNDSTLSRFSYSRSRTAVGFTKNFDR